MTDEEKMREERRKKRYALRRAVKTYYDLQFLHTRVSNRIGLKADGTRQNIEPREMLEDEYELFMAIRKTATKQMKELQEGMEISLQIFPLYTEWLLGVKGIGWLLSSVIIAEYDFEIATTVSKLWQFTGVNPGLVRGVKVKKKKDGSIERIVTDTMVRGDKLTSGFAAPFNQWLRTKILGVLGDSFLKQQTMPYSQTYYDYKSRLENSDELVDEFVGNGKIKKVKWRDAKRIHRHQAAVRKMMKHFLQDLYVQARTLEGLPVRKPYDEEYLGKKHDDGV